MTFHCPTCGATFVTSSGLRRHCKLKHLLKKPGRGRSICCWCNVTFKRLLDFHQHARLYHKVPAVKRLRSYICSICEQSYRAKQHLVRHMRASHPGASTSNMVHSPEQILVPSQVKEFVCCICREAQTSRLSLERHMLKQHAAAPPNTKRFRSYICSICERSYRAKQHLVRHMRASHPGASTSNIVHSPEQILVPSQVVEEDAAEVPSSDDPPRIVLIPSEQSAADLTALEWHLVNVCGGDVAQQGLEVLQVLVRELERRNVAETVLKMLEDSDPQQRPAAAVSTNPADQRLPANSRQRFCSTRMRMARRRRLIEGPTQIENPAQASTSDQVDSTMTPPAAVPSQQSIFYEHSYSSLSALSNIM